MYPATRCDRNFLLKNTAGFLGVFIIEPPSRQFCVKDQAFSLKRSHLIAIRMTDAIDIFSFFACFLTALNILGGRLTVVRIIFCFFIIQGI